MAESLGDFLKILAVVTAVGLDRFETVVQAFDVDQHILAAVTLGRVGPDDDDPKIRLRVSKIRKRLRPKVFYLRRNRDNLFPRGVGLDA